MVFIISKCQIGFSKIDISISVKCFFTDFKISFTEIEFNISKQLITDIVIFSKFVSLV